MVKYFQSGFLLILASLLFCFTAKAQKEGNIWYFGNHAGIDFNTGAAFPLTDGALSTLGGCATISDATGKLLFYTDGITIYDRTHHAMPNGTGLAGGISSTQSAIIVPKPLSIGIYYVFTVDYQMGYKGLEYSVVDMSKNGGNGDVVTKNVLIKRHVCEKLTAVQNSNKQDIWVIAHDSSRNYLSYLVTDSGVRINPVISPGAVNAATSVFNAIGYLKVSSGGNKLADAFNVMNLIETGDFDNSTGQVSNLQIIPKVNTVYGLEFSPDNTKLYATNFFDQQLYQFDLSSGNINKIIASRDTIYKSTSVLSAIQQAPDGRLYISRNSHSKMGVINNPNMAGKACNYNDQGFDLNGRICYSGLPTFVQSFFVPATDFVFFNSCLGDGTQFVGKTNINPDSWYWNFDDPVSAANNVSAQQAPVHHFSAAGTYHVIMVLTLNGLKDTIHKTVTITNIPTVNLGPDRTGCLGIPIGLDAGSDGFTYLWSTGDSVRKIQADSTGTYWVSVSQDGCVRSDTVNLTFVELGNFSLGHDTALCDGEHLKLTEKVKGGHILWSTGETDTAIYVTKTGYYGVRVSVGNCTAYDSILVFFEPPPVVNLGPARMLCEGETDTLNCGVTRAGYLWSTGETTQKIAVHQGGQYWVEVIAAGCRVFDTINIIHCPANIYLPDIFSPNKDLLNDRFKPYGTDIAQFNLMVINRWGEIVYHSTDALGWDGNFENKPCPGGLYFYKLIYRAYDGEVLYDHLLTGKFFLAR